MEIIIPREIPKQKRIVGSDDCRCVNKQLSNNYQCKTQYITEIKYKCSSSKQSIRSINSDYLLRMCQNYKNIRARTFLKTLENVFVILINSRTIVISLDTFKDQNHHLLGVVDGG